MWFSHSWLFFLGFFHEFKNTIDEAIINFNSEEKNTRLFLNYTKIKFKFYDVTGHVHVFLDFWAQYELLIIVTSLLESLLVVGQYGGCTR